MEQRNMKRSIFINSLKDRIFMVIIAVLSLLTVVPLVLILFYIFKNGVAYVNFDLLFNLPKPTGDPGGGISNAIVGTLILIFVASVIAIPIGIFAGIYLSEHKHEKLAQLARITVDVLQGVPSIVIGIVAYICVVLPVNSFSAFSGSVALAVMMLPVVIKNTEETLKLIPSSLKEAAYALGVPYHNVILRIVLPAGLSGILTGILLSIARIAGETAPLLFTAFGNPFMSLKLTRPIEALPHIIFKYATSPYADWQNIAWGASFLLVAFVLLLNLIAKVVIKKWKVTF
jgi:phosphate transport system permease protein